MKYLPKDPWWLNQKVECGNCKGYAVLDSLLDAQEMELVMTEPISGEHYRLFCPGCGAAVEIWEKVTHQDGVHV